MSRFRFSLARVLRARELFEVVARAELAAANARSDAADGRVERAKTTLCAAIEAQRVAQSAERIDALRVVREERHVALRGALIADARAAALLEHDRAAGARDAWLARRVDARALEKLKVRARTAHAAHETLREIADLDEAAARRFGDGRRA